jgi:hypothetical protein
MSGLWTPAIPNLITVSSRSRMDRGPDSLPEISGGLAAFGLIRPNGLVLVFSVQYRPLALPITGIPTAPPIRQ